MTTLVNDTFTGANGTAIPGRAPSPVSHGSNWAATSGSAWQIQSNAAQQTIVGGTVDYTCTVDCGGADVTYTCDFITPVALWNGGLIFNYVDDNNYWLWDTTFDGTHSTTLYEKSGGSFTSRGTEGSGPLSNSTTYNLKIVTKGDTVTLYRNGVQVILYTTAGRSSKTATKFGFRFANNGIFVTPTWDNFLVANDNTLDLLLFAMEA